MLSIVEGVGYERDTDIVACVVPHHADAGSHVCVEVATVIESLLEGGRAFGHGGVGPYGTVGAAVTDRWREVEAEKPALARHPVVGVAATKSEVYVFYSFCLNVGGSWHLSAQFVVVDVYVVLGNADAVFPCAGTAPLSGEETMGGRQREVSVVGDEVEVEPDEAGLDGVGAGAFEGIECMRIAARGTQREVVAGLAIEEIGTEAVGVDGHLHLLLLDLLLA